MAETESSPQDEVVSLQDIKVFAIERHELPEDFGYFRSLWGVQHWPLVFAPNRAFGCGPLQGQAPGETLCFVFVLS